ncbi:TPA: hypothetical protein EYP12_06645 [Candidatus Bipolaricaulota bacterium]|nr:hypothetical protein [Candidatus Bipolaricaulota bacterium]
MTKIQDSFRKTLEVKGPLRLEVETGSGNIVVRRGEEGRLSVSGEFQVRARSVEEARELAERIKEDPPIEVVGELVRIGDLGRYELGLGRDWWPFGPSVMIDFTIEAPAETSVQLRSGSGDQEVRGIQGPLKLRAGSGDVEVEEIEADVAVTTGSGDIEVAHVRGGVEAEAGSGDIFLAEVAGRVEVEVGSGDVRLKEMGGDIAVEAGSGDIAVESAIGDRAKWALEASSGDVSLRLPEDSQFKLHIKTSSGEFATDFPLAVSGRIGREVEGRIGTEPTAEIRIATSSGDIELKQKKAE